MEKYYLFEEHRLRKTTKYVKMQALIYIIPRECFSSLGSYRPYRFWPPLPVGSSPTYVKQVNQIIVFLMLYIIVMVTRMY